MLAPDYLAIACEIFAQAVAGDEGVIIGELRSRYLEPWCDVAARRLSDEAPRLTAIVERFRDALRAA